MSRRFLSYSALPFSIEVKVSATLTNCCTNGTSAVISAMISTPLILPDIIHHKLVSSMLLQSKHNTFGSRIVESSRKLTGKTNASPSEKTPTREK